MATRTEIETENDDLKDFIMRKAQAAADDEEPSGSSYTSPQSPLPKITLGDAPYVKAIKYWKKKVYKSKIADLSARDVERANFVFSIYDFDGNGTVDAVNLGDMLRALNQNPTLATIEKLGGTKKKNEKKLKVEEFLPIFSQVKKDKEQGQFDDFLEALKLYDKEENGKMMAAELAHTLLSLGERLSDAETDEVLADCLEKEDDDGFVPYEPFLKKMMA
ncbi:myosin light chain 1 isoform X1 [Cylas formicarius]|uniref:myosin light chain 1 isoform X1 n=1 Tax=Cylas formicarius TaxID=197179 RepID=UPI002958365E|nr:myosin light chain 1 isoform X1 [Cylas formicarius]